MPVDHRDAVERQIHAATISRSGPAGNARTGLPSAVPIRYRAHPDSSVRPGQAPGGPHAFPAARSIPAPTHRIGPGSAPDRQCARASFIIGTEIRTHPSPAPDPASGGFLRPSRSSSERQHPVAKQTTVTLVDDLDGSEADEQVEFAMDGKSYEIDLSSANSARLREALAPFISAARRTSGRRRSGGAVATARPSTDREQNQAIREWAQQQGMKISERGRIPSNVLEAYHKAH
ncbi:hypothetical protein GCM10009559_73340 [Pseudonocardia zijingensis]|uniref:Lsr2 protein n=1 Tax=Pseudonocardia zijingensis TaxID=153376 RepID=A0ABP3YX65_9PSEU